MCAMCLTFRPLDSEANTKVAYDMATLETVKPETDVDCSAKFKSAYFEYRKRSKISKQEDDVYFSDPQTPPQRILFDVTHVSEFAPEEELLNCASKAGDQLANYVLALRLLKKGSDIEEFSNALIFVKKANLVKEGAPEKCRDIDEIGDYECKNGLPEASLLIGQIYGNCKLEYYNQDKAKKLLWYAVINRVFRADDHYGAFINVVNGHRSCF